MERHPLRTRKNVYRMFTLRARATLLEELQLHVHAWAHCVLGCRSASKVLWVLRLKSWFPIAWRGRGIGKGFASISLQQSLSASTTRFDAGSALSVSSVSRCAPASAIAVVIGPPEERDSTRGHDASRWTSDVFERRTRVSWLKAALIEIDCMAAMFGKAHAGTCVLTQRHSYDLTRPCKLVRERGSARRTATAV